MKYIVIRDDDVNYFTKTEWLEELYGPFLKRGLPIGLSVIPATKCDLYIPNPRAIYRVRENIAYEPFIPPEYRGKKDEFETGNNKGLVDFVKRFRNIEICQHGYKHEYVNNQREFDSRDIGYLDTRLKNGRLILEEAFERKIDFFVSPWDYLSSAAIIRLKKAGYKGLSLYRLYKQMRPPLIQRFFSFRENEEFCLFGKFLILTHPGYIFSRFNTPEVIQEKIEDALKKRDILVVVNHHWEYFFDWAEKDSVFFAAWKAFYGYLFSRNDIEFVSFNTLYQRLAG